MLLYAIAMDHEHSIMNLPVQGKIAHEQRRPTWSLRKPSWTSQSGETCSTDSTRSVATLQEWSHGEHAVGLAGKHIGLNGRIMDGAKLLKHCNRGTHFFGFLGITVGNFKTSTPCACTAPGRLRRNKWNQLGIRPSTCQDCGNMAAELHNFLERDHLCCRF